MSYKLSNNFSLEELCFSSTANKMKINNYTTDNNIVSKLKLLCEHILQPVREHYGKPVVVNSGYRCPSLNKAVGGAKTSQHLTGEACDFEIMGLSNYELANWIKDNLEFDQLILEFCDNLRNDINSGWVHCSYKAYGNRHQCLTINKKGARNGLIL
jgi:hypothetical protein